MPNTACLQMVDQHVPPEAVDGNKHAERLQRVHRATVDAANGRRLVASRRGRQPSVQALLPIPFIAAARLRAAAARRR